MNSFETFLQLHRNNNPFILANCWNVKSALLFEEAGYKAIATSSQAAATAMGYEDGEKISFEELLSIAKRITKEVRIPFSVDAEAGYGRNAATIALNIEKLHDAGVSGINLEDSIAGAARTLQTADAFEKILETIKEHTSRKNLQLFINIRTDAFLLGMSTALAETLNRINIYKKTGVDGIFVPCIYREDDITAVVKATTLPVNVMCVPGLPGFDKLGQWGVKRISMGPFFFNSVYQQIKNLSEAINTDQNFSSILS